MGAFAFDQRDRHFLSATDNRRTKFSNKRAEEPLARYAVTLHRGSNRCAFSQSMARKSSGENP